MTEREKIAEIRERWDDMATVTLEETEAIEFEKVMKGEQK